MKVMAKSVTGKTLVLVAVGTRGVAFIPAVQNKEGQLAPTEDHNGKKATFPFAAVEIGAPTILPWKGKGEQSELGKAFRAWVSPAGAPIKVYKLEDAKRLKVIKAIKVKVDGGKPEEAWVSDHKVGQKLPQYLGTTRPGGRLEPYVHPDGKKRQGLSHHKVEVA